MRTSHEIFVKKGDNGSQWDYYIDTHFALLPDLIYTGQVFPEFVWFKFWYDTYPVDEMGKIIDMYHINFTSDPRQKK